MSKVDISVDTSDQSLTVKVDGQAVKDVNEVFLTTKSSMFGFSLDISSKRQMGDLTERVRLVALDSTKGKELIKLGTGKVIGDFIVTKEGNPLSDQISEYLHG